MSRENVETLRAFMETWSREWTLEAWRRGGVMDMSFIDPDVVYEDDILPDHIGETYRGHEGWLRAAESWFEPLEWLRLELERIVDAGDHLVSVHHMRSRARHTGIEFDSRDGDTPPLSYLWTFRDGKVVHLRAFGEPEEAFGAAGLPKG
jgi:ketosteroid isomerase-like protein